MCGTRRYEGQATVELVALLPVLVAVTAVVWQFALAGHAVWAATVAARAAARAHAVGADAPEAAAARLPRALADSARVTTADDGTVEVRVRIPAALGVLRPATATARAHFAPQQ